MPSDPWVKKNRGYHSLNLKKQVDNTIFCLLLINGEFEKISPPNKSCTCKSATEYCKNKKKKLTNSIKEAAKRCLLILFQIFATL